MDIKEIGTGAVLVIGGVAYGVSSGGLADALSSDVKHVTQVAYEDRAEYMNDIVEDFTETFDVYIVQTETYDLVGHSKFSASATKATFVEVVQPDDLVPKEELKGIKAKLRTGFCEQEEMTMFTEKGWNYSFTLKNADGRKIQSVSCRGDRSGAANKPVS